jgi:hypothetical protein
MQTYQMKKLILTLAIATAVVSFVGTTLRADDASSSTNGGDTQCRHGQDGGLQCGGTNSYFNAVQCGGTNSGNFSAQS